MISIDARPSLPTISAASGTEDNSPSMDPVVVQLVPLAKPHSRQTKLMSVLGHHAAAPGMHFIVNGRTEKIFKPAMFFLLGRHGDDGRVTEEVAEPSLATSRSTAYELAEFLRFLSRGRKNWKTVSHRTLIDYARLLVDVDSPVTGRKRVSKTIGHKFSTVLQFYNFANKSYLKDAPVRWDGETLSSKWKRGRAAKQGNKLKEGQIRPFSETELEKIATDLGPLPTQRNAGSLRPCRDRLLVQLGLATGMRGEEVCYLQASTISKLKADPNQPGRLQPITITKTKRKLRRNVSLRNETILELQQYIRTERKAAVEHWLARHGSDHGYLFVNHADASRPGAQLRTSTLHKLFRALMVRVGCTTPVPRTRKGVRESYLLSTHSYHDLRHTFAIRMYIRLKSLAATESAFREALSEPWAAVAVALGHDDWATTKNVYLKAPGLFLSTIGEKVEAYFGGERI